MNSIEILPIGSPNPALLKRLVGALARSLGTECHILDKNISPSFALISNRSQYNSTSIIEKIGSEHEDSKSVILGVTDVDLCIPILTFVFGEAQVKGKAAILSVFRLRQEFYGLPDDDNLLFERTLKEAIHEIGHTFGLKHCSKWSCVMHTSNSAEEIDIKGDSYCATCSEVVDS